MKKCQKCDIKLVPLKTNYGKLIICNNCFGHYYSENTLEILFKNSIWIKEKEKAEITKSKLECPKCKRIMKLHRFSKIYNSVELDICSDCKIIWLDYNEIEELKLNSLENKKFITNTKNNVTDSEINYILNIIKLDSNLNEAKSLNKVNTEACKFSEIHIHPGSLNRGIFNGFDIITLFKTILKKE